MWLYSPPQTHKATRKLLYLAKNRNRSSSKRAVLEIPPAQCIWRYSLSRVFPESPKRFFQTGQRQSGVSTPAEKPFIMLFTADFTNKNNALYNDGWIEVRHVSFGV